MEVFLVLGGFFLLLWLVSTLLKLRSRGEKHLGE